jgi:hypothetical protein
MKQTRVVIESWRQEDKTIQSHYSLNGVPPQSETVLPMRFQPPRLLRSGSEFGLTLNEKMV